MTYSTCAFCKHENPARAKFCNECASPLAVKPCDACEAVNAKAATACHRCKAPFAAIALDPEVSAASIVAQADETLAELRRELAEATARTSRSVPPDRALAPVAPAGSVETDVSRVPSPVMDRIAAGESTIAFPRGEHFIKLDEASAAASSPPTDRTLDALRAPSDPGTVVLRGRRPSPAVTIAVIALLLALPVGIYAWRNPDQLQDWVSRLATLLPDSKPATSSSEAPAVASPASSAPSEASAASAAGPADARATDQAATSETSARPPDDPSPTIAAPAAEPPVKAAPAPVAPAAKSASSSRSRASSSKGRPSDRATRPRSPSNPAPRRASPPVESFEPSE